MNAVRYYSLHLAKRLAAWWLLLIILELGQVAWAGLVTYNDFGTPGRRDPSVSRIGATPAELKAGNGTVEKTGKLIDFADGQASGVQLKFTLTGSPLGQAERGKLLVCPFLETA